MKRLLLSMILPAVFSADLRAQNTFLTPGSDEYHLLERLEARSGILSNNMFLNVRPVSRRDAVDFLLEEKSNFYNSGLTNIDQHNINQALSISNEWLPNSMGQYDAARPGSRIFYKSAADLYSFHNNNFFCSVNPALSLGGIYESNNGKRFLYNTTQGAELRGRFRDILGVYFFVTNNYEEPVAYFRERIDKWDAIPNAGTYNRSGNGLSYLKFRGYADVALVKDHISLTVGYDNHFIGDGYRSLFLSDFSEGAAFARINTKIWKLSYQNLYTILKPQRLSGEPKPQGSKFATTHYLSFNATHWLNLGLFETVTFTRNNGYEFGYLNPIIFYRAVERGMGSPDKVSIGFNAKALLFNHISLYTQLLINEFTIKELTAGNGYWANKWGAQLGIMYFDAFTIPNLDIRAELNVVRPYTYQHYESLEGNSMANYSHYNLPLAHPLGAGFGEVIAIARYQPLRKLTIEAQAMYYKQGIDTGNTNYGSDILKSYADRPESYGVKLINGSEAQCLSLSLNLMYELMPRLYVDLGVTQRRYTIADNLVPEDKNLYIQSGVRLNLGRRNYNVY